MMTPIEEGDNDNDVGNKSISALDPDISVTDASASSIENMMKQALATLQWKREHPNQDPPETMLETTPVALKLNDTPGTDDCENQNDTSDSEESETNRNHSTRGSTYCGRCGKSTLLSLLGVFIAIICILAIAISMSSSDSGSGSSSDNANASSPSQDEKQPLPDGTFSPGNDVPPESTITTSSPSFAMSPQETAFSSPSDAPIHEACSFRCTQASDCHDANNLQGLNQDCGELSCVAGICRFEAWKEDGNCNSTNYLRCYGDDMMCTKGPSELSYAGTCTRYENSECTYQWCRGNVVAQSPGTSSPSIPLPVECSTPCIQASDCEDVNNLEGMDPSCGVISCVSGFCQFNAWNAAGDCHSNNYLYCDGDDTICTKGPRDLSFEGTCTGFENKECVYQWCPGI